MLQIEMTESSHIQPVSKSRTCLTSENAKSREYVSRIYQICPDLLVKYLYFWAFSRHCGAGGLALVSAIIMIP